MGIKDMFKKRESLTNELRMLPRDTKRRILDNVNRRRSEIIEEKLLESQLRSFQPQAEKGGRMKKFSEGMRARRKELQDNGMIQPIIRVNRENFRSPMEEASKRARAAEIKALEDQRNRMKAGSMLESGNRIQLKELKLKIPRSDSQLLKRRKTNSFRDGII